MGMALNGWEDDAMTIEPSQTSLSRPGRRVGDVQRADCVELLASAFVKGELSQMEYDARTESCLVAVTDVDLARLTSDLPAQANPPTVSSTALTASGASAKAVSPSKVLGFEAILVVVACLLGIDATDYWFFVAFQFWVVGNLAGVAGVFFLRPTRPSQP